MLTSFTVTNYRSFVDPTRIELRPLTLLFGPNNAGKSALLRVLPLIAESIRDGGRDSLKLGEASRDGSFDDLVSRLRPGRALGLELAWAPDASYAAQIRYLPELYRQVITELKASLEGHKITARWIPEEDPQGRLGNRYELSSPSNAEEVWETRLEFAGLAPGLADEGADQVTRTLIRLRKNLQRIATGIQWLGALRAVPLRRFPLGGAPPLRLDPDGSGFTKVLFFDKKAQRGGLWGEVSDWFEEHFHQVLELVEVAEEGYLALSPVEAAGLRIPLADTGEGLAQILPVLVALAMARRPNDAPQLVALEQPELHLHPAAEVALGEHLAEIAAAPDPPTLVVETHSENLMLSVQLRIAEGSLPPDAVGAYWVERLEDGRSLARQVEFDDAGRTSGWPEGVFSEDIHLARQMFRLRRERSES